MSDYISRSEVITQLCNIYCACGPDECQFKIPHDGAECCMTVKAILDIPDAEVVPRKLFMQCRNELCLRCGAFQNRHKGACDGCLWKEV